MRRRLAARARAALPVSPAWRMPLAVFGWAQLILLVWWAGQWPGLLSRDSVRYVLHVTTGPWTADHSVPYDAAVLAVLTTTHSVAPLTLLQTTAAAAVLAYVAASIRAVGVPGHWAALPALLLPIIPSFGAFVSTVWKDVPFALCELLVIATSARLVAHRHAVPDRRDAARTSRRLLAALGAEFAGLVFFRNDGFVAVIVLAVIFSAALAGLRVQVLALAAVALVAFFVAGAVIYPAVGIRKQSSSLAYGTFYADIAIAYAASPGSFTAADKALLARVAPLHDWQTSDNCYTSDPLFGKRGFNAANADRLRTQLADLWVRTVMRSPTTVTMARLCRSSIGWNVLPPPPDRAHLGEVVGAVPPNLYGRAKVLPADVTAGLVPHPLTATLGRLTHVLRKDSGVRILQPVLWRGATWCYVAYVALFVAVRRMRRADLLLVGAVCLAGQLTVIAANPAQLYRYMAGPLFGGMLLAPLFLAAAPQDIDDASAPRASLT